MSKIKSISEAEALALIGGGMDLGAIETLPGEYYAMDYKRPDEAKLKPYPNPKRRKTRYAYRNR